MQREALNGRASLARRQRLPHKVRDILAWIQTTYVPLLLPVLISASLKERQLREWRPSLFTGSSQPVPAQLKIPTNYFYPPTCSHFQNLLSTPHHSTSPPTALLYLSASYLPLIIPSSCASCSVDHLLCSPQGYFHCTLVKANLVESRLQSCSPLPSTRSVVPFFERCHSLPSPLSLTPQSPCRCQS